MTTCEIKKDDLKSIVDRLREIYNVAMTSDEVDIEEIQSIGDQLEDLLPLPTLADLDADELAGAYGRFCRIKGSQGLAVLVGTMDDQLVAAWPSTGRVGFGFDPARVTPTKDNLRAWQLDGSALPQGEDAPAPVPLTGGDSDVPENIESEEQLRNLPNGSIVKHQTSALAAVKHTKNRWRVTGHDGALSADELWMLFEEKVLVVLEAAK